MEFRELHEFTKAIDDLATAAEFLRLQMELARNPEKGKLIAQTGGARKIRMGLGNRGKSGGARVIYYWQDLEGVIWLLKVYAKNAQSDLSGREKSELAIIINDIKKGLS
jgi:mRNA-degrading endonuclease RelE of RelBE toxin-antitoxin system